MRTIAPTLAALSLCLLAATAQPAPADNIVTPPGPTYKGEMYNNSGLSSDLDDGDAVPETLPTHAEEVITGPLTGDSDVSQHWYGAGSKPGRDIYDFDAPKQFAGLILWNFNVTEDNGVDPAIDHSDKGVAQFTITYRAVDGSSPVMGLGSFNPTQATGNGPTEGQYFSFGETPLTAAQIRFEYNANFNGAANTDNGGFGLAEVRLVEVTDVPEPGSLTLLGFGLIAVARRLRRH